MSLLVYLILVVVALGAGTLAASLLPTRGARIGLGAALFLALIVDGTWFAAPLAGWSVSLASAIWLVAFALVVIGASVAARRYTRHPDLPAWVWPGGRDLAFLVVVIALFGALVWVLPVPLDTDAQGFGYLALMLREGQDYTSLAPWHPEIDYLYSPGYIGLIAHLSALLDPDIAALQLAFSALTAVLFVWTAYDLGSELGGPRAGRGLMLAAVIGTGLITAFMDAHYTALLALLFSLAFITFVVHFLESRRWSSALFAAICLAGVPLSQPDTTLALVIGYVPWLVLLVFARPRPGLRGWLVLAVVIPLVALGITLPWLDSLRDLLAGGIESPFTTDLDHWRTMILMHGGAVVVLALVGLLIGLRRRRPAHLLMIVWLVAIVEFSMLGWLEETFPDLLAPLLKYDYPFSLAWHGPIIPYTVLGGLALVWLADRLGGERFDRWVRRLALPVLALALVGIVLGVVFFDPLLDASREHVDFYGAFASSADVDAMRWLRDNAPAGARILNHPGPHEGDWAPVIAERDTLYFRPQPFFQNSGFVLRWQDALRDFWRQPDNDTYLELLDELGVRYVLVPQVIGNPASLDGALRWRPPVDEAAHYTPNGLNEVPFLRLVYEQDGAQVYEVIPPEARAD
ncbi:MAG: hypothetical protein GXY36_12645 [Chloroflexi bacterium]|nr:hypothetical protein [Chloroflexota bacterium]